MKTNECGAVIGTLGKERGKLLAIVAVLALIACGLIIAMPSGADASVNKQLETADEYVYDDYTYNGLRTIEGNTVSMTYMEFNDELPDMLMNDFARYMGALYRANVSADIPSVTGVVYDGTTYTWNGDLKGSNWKSDAGNTLVSVVTDDFRNSVSIDGGYVDFTINMNDGVSADMTYSVNGAVAEVDGKYYGTLAYATDAAMAIDSESSPVKITLVRDAEGSGVKVQSGSNLVFDFNDKVYTNNGGVGSTGTETNGFQLLRDSTVVFMNGTLKAATSPACQILIQNYSNLTINDMKVLPSSTTTYTLSSNNGQVTIEDSIIVGEIDVMYWPTNGYTGPSSIHTIDTVIKGNITYGTGSNTDSDQNYTENLFLTISGGEFNGLISTYGVVNVEDANIAIDSGTISEPSNVQYLSNDATVTLKLQSDETGSITIPVGVEVTLDLNGFKLKNTAGLHTITNYGTLKVVDSSDAKTGTVDNVTHGRASLYNAVGATATLDNGIFIRSLEAGASKTDDGGNSYYTIQNQGTMTVNSGVTVYNDGVYSSCFTNGWYTGVSAPFVDGSSGERVTAKLTINGGDFYGGINTIKNDDLGVIEINGGTFDNYAQYAMMNAHIGVVNGGEFLSNTNYSMYCYGADPDDDDNNYIGDGKLTINGGKFSGGIYLCSGSTFGTDEDGLDIAAGNVIFMNGNVRFDGTIICEGSKFSGDFTTESVVSIVGGSITVNGLPKTGEITVSGSDITISGIGEPGTKIIVKPQDNGEPTNITWSDFDQGEADVEFQNASGETAENPDEVAKQTYQGQTSVGGISITTIYPEGTKYIFSGESYTPPSFSVSVTGAAASAFLKEEENGTITYNNATYNMVFSTADATIYKDGAKVSEAVNAGTYSVLYAYFIDNKAYVLECNWEIVPKDIHITIDDEKVYDGEELKYTITNENITGLADGDTITGTITTNSANVGTYNDSEEWQISGLSSTYGIENYNVYAGTIVLDITAKPVTITVTASENYDGQNMSVDLTDKSNVQTDGIVDGESITTGTITTTGHDVSTYTAQSSDWSVSNLEISSGVGNYNVTYIVNLTIAPAPLTIDSVTVSDKVYDGNSTATIGNVVFGGLVNSETLAASTDYAISGTYSDVNAGNGISVSGTVTLTESDTAKNYYVVNEGAFTTTGNISKREISIDTVTVDGKTYDGTENWNVSKVEFSGLVEGESLTMGTDFTVSTEATWSINAGTGPDYTKYADVTVTLAEDLNYSFESGDLTSEKTNVPTSIKPIAVTEETIVPNVTIDEESITISVSIVSNGLSPTGFTSTLTGPGSETSSNGSNNVYTVTSAGTYAITISAVSDNNWSLYNETVTKTIDIDLYEAVFFTATSIENGEPVYSDVPTQTVSGSTIMLPFAADAPVGYELYGWKSGETTYKPGAYVDIPVDGMEFRAVYALISGEGTTGTPDIVFNVPAFTAGQEGMFQVTFVANAAAGQTAVVKATFNGSVSSMYYWNVNINDWSVFTESDDGAYYYGDSGFSLMDATSNFKATIANAGTYTLTVQILVNGDAIATESTTVVVQAAPAAQQYTVIYAFPEGVIGDVPAKATVDAGSIINLPSPAVDGKIFAGWVDDKGYYIGYGQYIVTDNVTLTARFVDEPAAPVEETYTVLFQDSGGSTLATYTGLTAGSVVTVPTVSSTETHRLQGWQMESGAVRIGLQQYFVFAGDDADKNGTIVLKAAMEQFAFYVTFQYAEGSDDSMGELPAGFTIELGQTHFFNVTAAQGYEVASVTIDGADVPSYGNLYVLSNVTSDTEITVAFEQVGVSNEIGVTVEITATGANVILHSYDGESIPTGDVEFYYYHTESREMPDGTVIQNPVLSGPVEVDYTTSYNTEGYVTVNVVYDSDATYAYAVFKVGNAAYYSALTEVITI